MSFSTLNLIEIPDIWENAWKPAAHSKNIFAYSHALFVQSILLLFRMISLLLLLVASVTLIATMPRLGKQRQHLQRIAESRRAANQAASAEQTTHDELLDSSNDDDEHDYILVEDDVVADDDLQSVFEKTIQWKEGAGQQFRKAYTGDSRATKYRRLAQANVRLAVASKCRSITDYFQTSQGSNEAPNHTSRERTPCQSELLDRAISSIETQTHWSESILWAAIFSQQIWLRSLYCCSSIFFIAKGESWFENG